MVRVRVRDGREFIVHFLSNDTFHYRRDVLKESGVPSFLVVIARRRQRTIFFFSETKLREILLTDAVASRAVWFASNARSFYEKLHAAEAPEGFVPSAEGGPDFFDSKDVLLRASSLMVSALKAS